MKILTIISAIVTIVAARYPKVTSWDYKEVSDIVFHNKYGNRDDYPCLTVMLDTFLLGLKDDHDELKSTFREEDLSALILSPMGRHTWNLDELRDAATIIIKKTPKNRIYSRRVYKHEELSIQMIEDALRMMDLQPIDRTVIINSHILFTLSLIMKKTAAGHYMPRKDDHKVKIPLLDLSIWSPSQLHHALQSSDTSNRLKAYLNHAVSSPHTSLGNGGICVVTPANVMPSNENYYYYLPDSTKNLLKIVRQLRKNEINV